METMKGSSPLARGLPVSSSSRGSRAGIIPARAGFTGAGRARVELQGDHPRSRGVYEGEVELAVEWCGSSPLARGLPVAESS